MATGFGDDKREFRFTLNRKVQNSMYFECVRARSKCMPCKARIVTVGSTVKSVRGNHNH